MRLRPAEEQLVRTELAGKREGGFACSIEFMQRVLAELDHLRGGPPPTPEERPAGIEDRFFRLEAALADLGRAVRERLPEWRRWK